MTIDNAYVDRSSSIRFSFDENSISDCIDFPSIDEIDKIIKI